MAAIKKKAAAGRSQSAATRSSQFVLPESSPSSVEEYDYEHEFMPAKAPKTIYNNVSYGKQEGGRLVLNRERMMFFCGHDQKQTSLPLPYLSIHHYHTSPDFFQIPLIRIVFNDDQSITFQMHSRRDLQQLKMDLSMRLFRIRKQQQEESESGDRDQSSRSPEVSCSSPECRHHEALSRQDRRHEEDWNSSGTENNNMGATIERSFRRPFQRFALRFRRH